MKTSYPDTKLEDMNYHVQRLNRMGYACATHKRELKHGEFMITRPTETSFELETCGDLSQVQRK